MMSAVDMYAKHAAQMNESYLQQIDNFYQEWQGQDEININHRFIKIIYRTLDDDQIHWKNLHQLANKRRITNEMLPDIIRSMIRKGIYPLRIFHSCTEWLAPNEVWTSQSPRIIRSGILPIENDDDLSTSLTVAKLMDDLVQHKLFVYSGNKSVHTWILLEEPELEERELAYADLREQVERKYREKMFRGYRKKIPYALDDRISSDPRRVLPIIGTINAFTGRKVTLIPTSDLHNLTADKLKSNASIYGWV